MKSLLISCAFALTLALVNGDSKNKAKNVDELIPYDKLKNVFNNHVKSDPGTCGLVNYLKSPEWTKDYNAVLNQPDCKKFMQFMENKGLALHKIITYSLNTLKDAKPTCAAGTKASGKSLAEDMAKQFNVPQLKAFVAERVKSDPALTEENGEARKIGSACAATPEAKKVGADLKPLDLMSPKLIQMAISIVPPNLLPKLNTKT